MPNTRWLDPSRPGRPVAELRSTFRFGSELNALLGLTRYSYVNPAFVFCVMTLPLKDRRHPVALSASFLLVSLTFGGCDSTHSPEIVGSIATASESGDHDPRPDINAAATLYRNEPSNPDAAMRYARALTGIGERSQAAA